MGALNGKRKVYDEEVVDGEISDDDGKEDVLDDVINVDSSDEEENGCEDYEAEDAEDEAVLPEPKVQPVEDEEEDDDDDENDDDDDGDEIHNINRTLAQSTWSAH